MRKELEFKELEPADLVEVQRIYNHYVLHNICTFHTEPLKLEEVTALLPIQDPKYHSYLVSCEGQIVGYAYLSRFKEREAYDRTAEVSIYLAPDFQGKGLGRLILDKLEADARSASGIKNLIAVVTAENEGSVKLFLNAGYHQCAHYKRVGEKFGRVLDVLAFQKEIELD